MRRGSPLVALRAAGRARPSASARATRGAPPAMFLEASVSHMITGDMRRADRHRRARARARRGRRPGGRAARDRGDRRGVHRARRRRAGRRAAAAPASRTCWRPIRWRSSRSSAWPRTPSSGSRSWDRAARILDRVLARRARRQRGERADLPARRAGAPRLPARPLGAGAGRARRSRSSSPRTPGSSPLLPHALAALALRRGRRSATRTTAARHVARGLELDRALPGRGDRPTCTPRSGCSSSGSAASPRRSRRWRPATAHDAPARHAAVGRAAARRT